MCLDFETIRKVIKDMELERNEALCERQQLEQDLIWMQHEICRIQKVTEKLMEDLDCLDRTASELRADNEQKTNCIAQKEREICCMQSEVQGEIERLECSISKLERDIEALNAEICKLEQCVEEKNRHIRESDARIHHLECSIDALKRDLCDLDRMNKKLREENACLRKQLDDCCENQLPRVELELSQTQTRLNQCECTKQELQSRVCNLKAKVAQACNDLNNEKACATKLQREIKSAQEEQHKLKMDNNCLKEDRHDLEEKLHCVERQLEKCQCDTERVQRECEELRQSIEEFKLQIVARVKCKSQANCAPAASERKKGMSRSVDVRMRRKPKQGCSQRKKYCV